MKIEDLQFQDKVVELLWAHYKENGGYTRTAAAFIEKLTGQKWERDKELEALWKKVEQLELENKQLKKQ